MANTGLNDTSMVSVHLIDEEKHFARHLDEYVDKCYVGKSNDDNGLNYHIVSVFGSQSTGKSTLLNKLFGTKFDVMDEEKRQQTTKGIWFSHANYIASTENNADETENVGSKKQKANDSNIYVLDVEGVDGRERADDKDFERKSALFALATSEVLIVNIFEHQVGLYQGANMELLKTVMEVNLSLFHQSKQKCLLLFVIRDFTGMTPLSNLGQSLEADMNKIWTDLNKPDECIDSKIDDFFDLKFFSITHKYYKPDEFEHNIMQLGDQFSNDTFFDNNKYHRKIPIDAWALYSEKIWNQIEDNKDLDLPTQQILVSKFKCNEILNNVYDAVFTKEFTEVGNPLENPTDSCVIFNSLRNKCLSAYDSQASRYQNAVYTDIRSNLAEKIDIKLKDFYSKILKNLADSLISAQETKFPDLKKKSKGMAFLDILTSTTDGVIADFQSKALEFQFTEQDTTANIYQDEYEIQLADLKKRLEEFSNILKQKESKSLINKLSRKFQNNFKEYVVEELSQPTNLSWDNIYSKFESLTSKLLKPYLLNASYDFKIGLSENLNESLHLRLMKSFWNKFDNIVHNYVNEETVSRVLRTVFEDKFKYDAKGLPLIWKDFNQIDSQFNNAVETAKKTLPIFSAMKLSNGKLIQKPVYSINDSVSDEDDDDDDADYYGGYESTDISDNEQSYEGKKKNRFASLLTTKQEVKINQRFKKESDAIYLDAKRSMVANRTSIPTFMYVLLLVLGWNELMIVVRNPILFILAIFTITGLYVAYNVQMLGPMISVGNAMFSQTKTVVKGKLRELLVEEDAARSKTAPNISPSNTKNNEEYELKDMK